MLHITDVKAVQAKINASSKEKALQAAEEDKVLQGQAAIKNGAVMEANSSVVDLAAFNTKAVISAALRPVKNIEQTLHRSSFSSQVVARSFQEAKQSLEEGWQDAQTMSFANMGIKHATIAVADVGARVVHTGIRMLRAQDLSIRTSTHGQGLAAFTKDIPISSTGLFGCDLSKAEAMEASASYNYKALVDIFMLSDLPSPKPPQGGKWKASS